MGMAIYSKIICAIPAQVVPDTTEVTKYDKNTGEPKVKHVNTGYLKLVVAGFTFNIGQDIDTDMVLETEFGNLTIFHDHNTEETLVGDLVVSLGDACYTQSATKIPQHDPSDALKALADAGQADYAYYHTTYISRATLWS